MINNEMHKVELVTLSTIPDGYGQPRQSKIHSIYIDMYIKLYTQTNTNNPIYNDVEAVGLTKFRTVNDTQQIIDGCTTYNVLKTIPSGQYLQVLLKKVK